MKKGKILKIKQGYNPNSSSIGTEIVVFITSLAGLSLVFSTVTAVLASLKKKKPADEG
jgi:hypothetical protein